MSDHPDSLMELSAPERESVGQLWLGRARGELATASVFEQVARAARELGAPAAVRELAEAAVHEELRHAELCRELGAQYLDQPAALPAREALAPPAFGDAPARVNSLLLLVYHCCINEGIAVAYLQENLRLAQAPAVRHVLHQLLRDDLVHARIGWAYLIGCDAGEREHVRRALPTLLRIGRETWLAPGDTPDVDCPAHGCLGLERHAEIVDAALEALILPGFAHVGIAPA